jgi:anthranilate/para-aminobenzoate synthase component I
MKVADLEQLESFALLGPGFGADGPVLLTDLEPVDEPWPQLFYAGYEDHGSEVVGFRGRKTGFIWDAPARPGPLPFALDADGYVAAVERIREAIARGDVYQVNLTVRASLPSVRGDDLLAAVCARGLPRFAAWVRLPDGVTEFVSGSPELFFARCGETIRAEPMKGTAAADDEEGLRGSVKDQAELAMITDLLRNDLTRICRPRSVHVANERRILTLAYATQAVSDIEGRLLSGSSAADVLAVLHPGGSVTGAPKLAAMQMIAELETSPRGAYCGTLGATFGDRTCASLLIRTAQRTGAGWSFGVGGGIVYDSEPSSELEEIFLKLGALTAR